MKFFTLPALLAAALFGAVVVVPFLPLAKSSSSLFALEARLASTAAGHVQVYYDDGHGLSEPASSRVPLARGDTPTLYRLPLPPGNFRALRFDPIDRDGTVTIESLRIVGRGGRVLRTIALSDLKPANQIQSLQEHAGRLEAVTTAGANDPQLSVEFAEPLAAVATWADFTAGFFPRALGVFAVLAALLLVLDAAPGLRASLANAGRWLATRPGRAVAIAAAVAVVASAYPVVFLGKSFVSPNLGTVLLYGTFPTLPGYADGELGDSKGSDIGAIMWSHIPLSMMQHRALAQGELPLWNRYNSAGTPLLGQGQSMFGDPLHLFVVLTNGAAWAWDIKFLVAKWLFAAGLGLLVLAVVGDKKTKGPRDQKTFDAAPSPLVPSSLGPLVSALLVSAAAPFLGFFLFRVNHPAFFSVCYAPWALYCWVRVTQAAGRRASACWAAGLVLANLALMNSGTAKEAYMLLLCMNFSGACVLLSADAPWRVRLAKLAGLAWAGAIFALLTAPVWATFLHTLKNSYTSYNAASAYQIQPGVMLGAFDELFYRPLMANERTFDPSVNFAILLGLLYFLATLRLNFANRAATALAASALLPLALAFGLVPPSWIVQLPFLGNIAHLDNTFTCALLVLWSVLAGVGFASAARRLGTPDGRADLAAAGLLLFALVFSWVAFGQAVHRAIFGAGTTFSALQPGQVIPVNPFVWGELAALLAASLVLAWTARRALARGVLSSASGLVLALCTIVLLWRTGLHAGAVGFDNYTARPTVRVDFHAKSEAVEFMRAAVAREPARGLGLHANFFPGWTGVYGLESIHGPDALVNPYFRELTSNLPGIERMWDWRLSVAPEAVGTARPFLDALNVRWYFDLQSDQAVLGRALKLAKVADLDVYESPTAWPRAFFTDRLDVYDQPAELQQKIKTGDGRPFAAAQRSDLAAEPALLALPRGIADRTIAPAAHYQLTENTTAFDVHASGPGVIVLGEVFWPGDFRAEVNGRKAPVLRINHAFKAVIVDAAGDYRVTFRYVPKNFPRNLAFCGLGALLLAGSLVLTCRRRAGL